MEDLFEIWKRMCAAHGKDSYNPCEGCPLKNKDVCAKLPLESNMKHSEFVTILEKWAEEHPVKTLKDRFFELMPLARKTETGLPLYCPSTYWTAVKEYRDYTKCVNCWNQPWKEEYEKCEDEVKVID